jgi:Uma2 family endonuclease
MILRVDHEPARPEDLDEIVDGGLYEFVDGQAVEKPMGAESGEVSAALMILLGTFVRQGKLGHMYDAQTGFQCFPNQPMLVRKPDVAFVSVARLPGKSPKGNLRIAPDLAVEVISPNDLYEEVEEKVGEYRQAGVKLIWIISPEAKTVLVRRLDRTCAELDETGTLSGEDVIPGFSCPVAELFV